MSLKFTDHRLFYEPSNSCLSFISPKCTVSHLHGLILIGFRIHCYLYKYVKVAREPILSSYRVWSVKQRPSSLDLNLLYLMTILSMKLLTLILEYQYSQYFDL